MVFLVYLWDMLVVFGYTTVMSAEYYPGSLVSSWSTIGILLKIIFMAVGMLFDVMLEFNSIGWWAVYDGDGFGFMGEGVLV